MTKYIGYESKKVKKYVKIWKIVELAYKMDLALNETDRRLKKITQSHIDENKCPKMRVKYATEVCSKTMADWITELATKGSKK